MNSLPSSTNIKGRSDGLCKSGHRWSNRYEKGDKSSPVEAVIIPVDAMSTVKFMNIEFALLDDVVVANNDASKWAP
jgi:hypothetical protein